MGKIIINNKTTLDMVDVFVYVKKVMDIGFVSADGTAYCYVTAFHDEVVVYATKNKSSHTFTIYRKEKLDK